MTSTLDLVCPKCRGRMGTYERSGIVVDQCRDCRGIFLDKGELERLVDTEGGGWSGMVGEPSGQSGNGSRDTRDDVRERDGDRDRRPETAQRPTKREGRLGGLLDLFGGE
jgi:Zn-finger nucleic acid-binding protein